VKILDSALFRRFDDIITYTMPTKIEIERLLQLKLHRYLGDYSLKAPVDAALGLSHAEVTNACNDALKEIILSDKPYVNQKLLVSTIKERKMSYNI
jgi:AAA+ superfamily predicted ATPase